MLALGVDCDMDVFYSHFIVSIVVIVANNYESKLVYNE